jgi:hypothetical protein
LPTPCNGPSRPEELVQALQAIQRQLDAMGMKMAAIYVEHALEALADNARCRPTSEHKTS